MKCIVDLMNVLFADFSIAVKKVEKESGRQFDNGDIGLFYHRVLSRIISLHKTYGEVIYANEGKGSLDWRRSIFPDYKRNRQHSDTTKILLDNLKTVEEMISYFPSKIISVDGAEGDDVMYSLATRFADDGEDVIIITGDGDIGQLLNYSDKIKVYSPMLGLFREKKRDLILEKAIVGDASDGIPGISRIGKKTYQKALADKNVWDAKIAPHMDDVNKFLQIVDLSKAPEYIKKEVNLQYDSKEFTEFLPQNIQMFMYEYKLEEHLSSWPYDEMDINSALFKDTSKNDDKVIEEVAIEDIEKYMEMINNI